MLNFTGANILKKAKMLVFLSLILFSCSTKDDIKKKIARMIEKPVLIDVEHMLFCRLDSGSHLNNTKKRQFSFVIYTDSTQCSPCFIKGLTEWNDILRLENSNEHDIQFFFIIEPRKNDTGLLLKKIKQSGFKHSVLVDNKSLFLKANPQIPKEAIYHTFLLDKNNNIILVGNPLINEDVKKLLYRRLNDQKVDERR